MLLEKKKKNWCLEQDPPISTSMKKRLIYSLIIIVFIFPQGRDIMYRALCSRSQLLGSWLMYQHLASLWIQSLLSTVRLQVSLSLRFRCLLLLGLHSSSADDQPTDIPLFYTPYNFFHIFILLIIVRRRCKHQHHLRFVAYLNLNQQ